jgi:WD40 repeat protein
MQFSPDGKALIIGDWRGRLQVINMASGTTDVSIVGHPEGITSVAWSPNGSIVASGSGLAGGPIRLWEAASGRFLGELKGHTSWICNLVFSADGQRLYSASADQTIRIWDVERRQWLATLRGSTDEVYGLALSPDGATLASGSKDGTVAFWSAVPASENERPGLITRSQFGYGMAAFAPDSRILAVRRNVTVNDANARVVSLLDLSTCDEIEQLPPAEGVAAISYSPDGALLVSGDWGGKVRVWSCAEHRQLQELAHSDTPVRLLHFPADGRRLLAVDVRGKAIWWDTVTWQPARALVVTPVEWATVSPDGHLIVSGTDTGAVRWLSAETGELLATVTDAHRMTVQGITFSADGSRAASVAQDGTVALWDPSSFRLIVSFKGHMQGAHAVAFSPDGLRLATGGGGRDSVRLWDLSIQPPRQLMALSGEGSLFNFVAFSPDGKWLTAAAQPNGTLHLWHAPTWEEIEAVEKQEGSHGPGQ